MKVKTEGLIGAALDWAVGTALNLPVEVCQIFQYGRPNGKYYISIGETDKDGAEVDFEPSEEWSQGGPIIEREKITIESFKGGNKWSAFMFDTGDCEIAAETPLVAAMRCYVASKFGESVEVPDELIKGN